MVVVLVGETRPRADIEKGITELQARLKSARDRLHREEIERDLEDLWFLWHAAGERP